MSTFGKCVVTNLCHDTKHSGLGCRIKKKYATTTTSRKPYKKVNWTQRISKLMVD